MPEPRTGIDGEVKRLHALRGMTVPQVRETYDVMRRHDSRWVTDCIFCLVMALGGCQGGGGPVSQGPTCSEIERQIDFADRIGTLNRLADAFAEGCHELVIVHGEKARSEFRHKTFSIMRETTSVFIPEGTFIEYVLESYERGYLSLLLAASYAYVHRLEEAKVELRQLDHELFTTLYNFGEDPVNLLLAAVLWERVGEPREARVEWLRLRDLEGSSTGQEPAVRDFAARQVQRIDEGRTASDEWTIYSIGRFPDLTWDLRFFEATNGYFSVEARELFLPACQSDTRLRLSTRSWFDKIALRHSHAYHPLLSAQAWIRLPVGLIYAILPVAAAAGIVVGGCVVDSQPMGAGNSASLP